MPRGNGGIIGPVNTSFSGVWSLTEAQLRRSGGTWPSVYQQAINELSTGSDAVIFGSAADPYFEYTTLLLPGNGTNGAQNNTFLDGSTNNFTITRNGNTTQGTFSPFSQTGWGNYFDGSGDCLSIPTSAISAVGSNNFSMECWVYPLRQTNTYSQGLISYGVSGSVSGTSYITLELSSSGYAAVGYAQSGSYTITSSTITPINQWSHIVVCRSGSTLSIFLNGTRVATTSTSATVGSSGNVLFIGSSWYANEAARNLQGYISNARIVNGASAYDATQSTITVPTSPLTAISSTSLLTCQSNRFVDNSASPLTITVNGNTSVQAFSPFNPSASWSAATYGGSGYFDGNGDYLSLADNAAFAMGTGNFTAEFWIYTQDQTNLYPGVISASIYNDTGAANIRYDNTGHANKIFVYLYGASPFNPAITSSTYAFGQWIHVALIRDSSTSLKLYVNGTIDGSLTISSGQEVDFSGANSFYVGRGLDTDGSNGYYAGYISGVRLVKGQALASGNFTPPSTPVTSSSVGWTGANAAASITGTVSFVSSFTNAGIYDATSKNDLETVGNAQISTAVNNPFGQNTGVMAFDETGDYLTLPASQNVALGSGDFTIECWARFAASTVSNGMGLFQLSSGYLNSQVRGPAAGADNTTGRWSIYYGTSSTVHASLAPSTNTWYHVAFVRASGTSKLYVDGTEIISVSDSTNYTDTYFTVGGWYSSSFLLNGYLQDLRVTKGYARYTSNFTPPTAAFPTL